MGKVEVFYTSRKELNRRFDPFCYIPELTYLEKQIKSKTSYTLSDFTLFRASGSTPSKSNNTLYSDKDNGIPFVRVQNLSTTGELDQSDMVYISKDTHEGLLKRSQVREYDLLVKITGVGRMAITSVAPKGFVGNINQHIVVIRTGSKEISENIATFLNLDIIERLASKRATGGTRPALDYSALFSIPIINDRMFFDIMHGATRKKQQKEEKAQELLGSIDDYLLGELGIKLPEQKENTTQNRIFSSIPQARLDCEYHHNREIVDKGSYRTHLLDKIAILKKGQSITSKNIVSGDVPVIAGGQSSPYNHNISNFEGDVITVSASGAYSGYVWYHNKPIFASDCTVISSKDKKALSNKYLFEYLKHVQQDIYKMQRGAGQPHVYKSDLMNIGIPLPPLTKQTEIANHITEIRNKAKQLREESTKQFEDAKQKIERIILGE